MRPHPSLNQAEHFLLGRTEPPDLAVIKEHGLSAFAYTVLPNDHPSRPTLRASFLQASTRHVAVKAVLLPLICAWRKAGIEVLIFKGFYLAEFVYPAPAQRFYGDVDVLIKPGQMAEAREIAKTMGWVEAWAREESLYRFLHEESRLDMLGIIRIEVHRFILDNHTPFDRLQRRFTEAAWKASSEIAWEDTSVRVLQPADSILMGLVLARAWSGGDLWKLKSHDFLDFKYLINETGLEWRTLRARARELRCVRTLELFLERCNPWEMKLDLREPSLWRRQVWNLLITPERGHVASERLLIDVLLRLPMIVMNTLRYLPDAWRVRQLLRPEADLLSVLKHLDEGPERLDKRWLREEEEIALGIKWASHLLWPLHKDVCVPRALALFFAYRKRGYLAIFYHGVNEAGGDRQEHAWVDLVGRRLEDFLNVEHCEMDSVLYRYPPAAGEMPRPHGT